MRGCDHLAPQNTRKTPEIQRRRDDNKNKICGFEGGGAGQVGAKRKIVQIAVSFLRGKRHDNEMLKVQFL